MKKMLSILVSCALVLTSLFTGVQAVVLDNVDNFHSPRSHHVADVLEDFKNGKFGDEVYYLASFGSWGDEGDIAVFQQDGKAHIVLYQPWGRYQERLLTDGEYESFVSFLRIHKADALDDWDTNEIMDGREYEYMHFTQDTKAAVYMNNPGTYIDADGFFVDDADDIYAKLVSLFWNLTETGTFQSHYDLKGAELLIRKEDHCVLSVWKNESEFKVFIQNSDTTRNWYTFDGSTIGGITDEPEGFSLEAAWDDVAKDLVDRTQNLNRYPWQAAWEDYVVRPLSQGLCLTKKDEEPKLLFEGQYSSPVVIPDTDWVICEKSIEGWTYPRKLVKINLSTLEETDVNLPPSEELSPLVFLNGRVFISQTKKNIYGTSYNTYLYDVTTDTLERVDGDFRCLSNSFIKGRFLQKTKDPNKYFALVNHFTIGIFNAVDFTLTEIANVNTLIKDNDHMWVDEDADKVYIVVNGDLISLPIHVPVDLRDNVKVMLNSRQLAFDRTPVIKNDRVFVPMRTLLEALGTRVAWLGGEGLIVASRGDNLVIMKLGKDSFCVINSSEYDTFSDLYQAVSSGDAEKSSTVKRFPFDSMPQILFDRTLIPVRAVSEALGFTVGWEDKSQIVTLSCEESVLSQENMAFNLNEMSSLAGKLFDN